MNCAVQQVKRLSTLAMLVECLMKYEGLESTKELCERTGKTDSHIRKAKREVACARSNMTGQIAPPVKYDRSYVTAPGQIAPSKQTGTELALNTESTNVDTLLASNGGVGEIPGLNGSSSMWIGKLAGLLAGDLGFPNFHTARTILASQVACYGPERATTAIVDLETKIALGERVIDRGKAFQGFVKNARIGAPQPVSQSTKSFMDEWNALDEREAMELAQ